MRKFVWLAVLVGCSSPGGNHATPPDAGTDVDDSSCTGDQDSDGVCDGQDVCPADFDPAQVDLDGDGIGWACDPYESTILQTPGYIRSIAADFYEHTFAVAIEFCPSSSCTHAIAAVSPQGKSFARGDSTAPQHAWLVGTTDLRGPYITRDERILWSTGRFTGDTGSLDLANDTFTVRSGKPIRESSDPRRPLELLELVGGAQMDLVRPQGDALTTIDTITGGYSDMDQDRTTLEETPGPSPVVEVPGKHGTGAAPYTYSLSMFDTSMSTLTAIPNLTDLDELWPVRFSTTLAGGSLYPELSYCARKGTSVMYVGIRGDGVTTGVLPFAGCGAIGFFENPDSKSSYVVGGRDAAQNLALAHVRDGVVTQVFTSEVEPIYVKVYGEALQLITTTNYDTNASKAWVIKTDGSVVPLAINLTNIAVSVHGATIHLVGMRDDGTNGASVVLLRYREGSGAQQVVLASNLPKTTRPTVVTSAEEAAIASDSYRAWAVPSVSMTPTQLNLHSAEGAARGTTTILISSQDSSHVTSQPALYAYDEPGGTPRLTQLTTESGGAALRLLDPPNGHSNWFAYTSNSAFNCQIARIINVNNAPALQSINCSHYGSLVARGLRGNGDVIADDEYATYVLSPTTATLVAVHSIGASLVYDVSTFPETIVGWFGRNAGGGAGYACLASHPERCWTMPPASVDTDVTPLATDASGDGWYSLMTITRGSATTVGVLRTIGLGDRAPPM